MLLAPEQFSRAKHGFELVNTTEIARITDDERVLQSQTVT